MYQIDTRTTQTRASQFPQTFRNTNSRVSISTGVTQRTSVSRPHLMRTKMKDKVVQNNSQVKLKKTEIKDHHRISSFYNNKTKFVTACNDILKSITSNVTVVCATCGKYVFNLNHDACFSKFINDVNARTKKPKVVPISARKPKRQANQSAATPYKKTVASESTIQKSKSYFRMLYENTSKAWTWTNNVSTSISPTIDIASRKTNDFTPTTDLVFNLSNTPSTSNSLADCSNHLFIVDSGCTKHMTRNLKFLCSFAKKYMGMVRFENDQFALILGYGDLVQGNVTIKRVYYIEGLNHNLFSVGQFCDADLEVAFRKSTCFIVDLLGNDLLTDNRGSNLYTISLQETSSPTSICFIVRASPTQAWLWNRRLSHLNFDTINLLSKKDIVNGLPKLKYVKDQLCSSCELGKAKKKHIQDKAVPSSKGRLNLIHIDLYGPMWIETIS
ncbi:retrovirus-related pol polyprotein from transposon TNT 1-94 [Tanacetum coccineum]